MLWEGFVFCFLLFLGCGHQEDVSGCKDTDLVLYNLVFETHWTRQLFPKQYPETRPPAHWSKVIGVTHDDNYVLFRIGEVADRRFKEFAETGKTEAPSGQKNVLDEFSSSSIKAGAGTTRVDFFADGDRSLASLAVKIIPSPDWFVGVDGLALCAEGTWHGRISRITSKWPRHPANSFYYPKLEDLPVIAKFHIVKKKFYQLTKKVEVRQQKNVTQTPPRAHGLDGSLPLTLGSHYGKRKRRKFKKYNAKAIKKLQEKHGQQ